MPRSSLFLPQWYQSVHVCVCLFRPAGLPVLLAAPLPRRGLVEVADQGFEPGNVAEG